MHSFAREYYKKEFDSTVTEAELEQLGAGALRKAAVEGDVQNGSFMCGQIAGMIHKEQSAADIITSIVTQAEDILTGGCPWIK